MRSPTDVVSYRAQLWGQGVERMYSYHRLGPQRISSTEPWRKGIVNSESHGNPGQWDSPNKIAGIA